ncbi:MAG: DUF2807 domain-containing protein [Defluviitaleaceae bacterium]|nr:DUF2807 domain-containing protein [Defluviitaleaceae bacterium]
MKRLILHILAPVAMLVMLAVCGKDGDGPLVVQGGGEIAKRDFNHFEFIGMGFTGISAGGMFDVNFSHSDTYSVRIVTFENLFENIHVGIDHRDVLIVSASGGVSFDDTPPRLYIEAPFLEFVNLYGAATASGWDDIKACTFELFLNGTASVDLALAVDGRLYVNMSWATSATLYGKADVMELIAAGTAGFYGHGLEVRNAIVSLSGSTRAYVYASDYLVVNSSGSSRVYYRGMPHLEQNAIDAARVSRMY